MAPRGNKNAVGNKGGRPTDYKPEFGELILAEMEKGLSLAAAAATINVHRQRVYEWVEKHPEFADTIGLAKSKRQLFLETRLLSATEGPVVNSSIFALKNAAGADWRDKVQQEHSGPDGGPVQVQQIQLVAVDPSEDSSD